MQTIVPDQSCQKGEDSHIEEKTMNPHFLQAQMEVLQTLQAVLHGAEKCRFWINIY